MPLHVKLGYLWFRNTSSPWDGRGRGLKWGKGGRENIQQSSSSCYYKTTSKNEQKRKCLINTKTEHFYFNREYFRNHGNIWWLSCLLPPWNVSFLYVHHILFTSIFHSVCIWKYSVVKLDRWGATAPDFSLGEGLLPIKKWTVTAWEENVGPSSARQTICPWSPFLTKFRHSKLTSWCEP